MSEKTLNISESELWDSLYEEIPLPLQSGEKTVAMIMKESTEAGRPIDYKSVQKRLAEWERVGKVEYVGKRSLNGKLCMAWRTL